MCLLFVVCYMPVCVICVVLLLNNFCLSLFFLWVDLMFVFSIGNSVVRIIILFVLSFDHFALILVRSFLLFVFMGFFFVVVSVLLHIKYLVVVCCLFFCRMSVLCLVFVEKCCLSLCFTSCFYDVCILFVQTVTTSFVSFFFL